jgi:hypothetical protein
MNRLLLEEIAYENLHNFYSSFITRVIKSRRMRLAVHVASMKHKKSGSESEA